MQWYLAFILISVFPLSLFAQADQVDAGSADSSLPQIEVKAYQGKLKYQAIPASIGLIQQSQIQQTLSPQLVQLINSISGVRLEERSPGSYRLSMRGSLLRAPFGVRNTKIYLNDFILSDAGGNTYLNLLALQQLQSIELIKGPAASMYGTGTGGVVLFQTTNYPLAKKMEASVSGGSFGTANAYLQAHDWQQQLHFSHFQADGYREQSALRRNMLQWSGRFGTEQSRWEGLFFLANLAYQTPGGLTLVQFNNNPKSARPPAGSLPGAVMQQTGIGNTTYFGGLRNRLRLNAQWVLQQQLQFSSTNFKNPFITNYEQRKEDNVAYRTLLQWKRGGWQWQSGAEWLYNHTLLNNFQNNSGFAGNELFRDILSAVQSHAYTQVQWQVNPEWLLQAGSSINFQRYQFNRISDPSAKLQERSIQPALMPRLAISYAARKHFHLFGQISRGFSPPSLAELRPSDGNYYGDLQPENGWNTELGIKVQLLQQQLFAEIAVYRFQLAQTIVRKLSNTGAEYFSNAGQTNQPGLEWSLQYQPRMQVASNKFQFWVSGSYQPYVFVRYQQVNQDFSGNKLTGIPTLLLNSGLQWRQKQGWLFQVQFNYTDKIPLNDANTFFAAPYRLLQGGISKYWQKQHYTITWFFNGDNLLNERYSLGNDLNAAGNRFYNAAPSINFNTGIWVNKG